jgi:threonine/homoserine/homoserine lactone efflux protein
MALTIFLLEAALISLSGVMSPGPVTATSVGQGSESPHAGALLAIGHGFVEVPLMVAVYYGAGPLLDLAYVKEVIAAVGGLFLLYMGIGMLKSARGEEILSGQSSRRPIVAGIVLSLGNPFFLGWWATVGVMLVFRSMEFGLLGFALFALVHLLCDLAWNYFLSVLSFKGGKLFGRGFQRTVFSVCGLLLLFFSGRLILAATGELF